MTADIEREDILNKVLISPRFTAYLETCSSLCENRSPNQFLDFLLSESANMLYIPEWEAKLIEMDINSLSNVVKSHVQLIDKNKKFFSKIKKIIIEIDDSITWDNTIVQNQNTILNHLFETLYHLQLATYLDTDADVTQPSILLEEIDSIVPFSTDHEITSYLNEIKGLLKGYKKIEIPSTIFVPKQTSISVEKKVKMLMQDSDFFKLSHKRYELSKTRNLSLLEKISILVRKISYNKKYQDIVKFAKLSNHYLPNVIQPAGNFLIENQFHKRQKNPLIVDIGTIIFEAELTETRKANPENFNEAGEPEDFGVIPFPWSVFSLPGKPIHRL